MIFGSANYVDCDQNHLTNTNKPYMGLSVSKELSFFFEPEEAKIHRSVMKFIGHSQSELRTKNQTIL